MSTETSRHQVCPDLCPDCFGMGWYADPDDVEWCGDPDHCTPRSLDCGRCGGSGLVSVEVPDE